MLIIKTPKILDGYVCIDVKLQIKYMSTKTTYKTISIDIYDIGKTNNIMCRICNWGYELAFGQLIFCSLILFYFNKGGVAVVGLGGRRKNKKRATLVSFFALVKLDKTLNLTNITF